MAGIWSIVVEYFVIFTDWIDERWMFIVPAAIYLWAVQGLGRSKNSDSDAVKQFHVLHTIKALLFAIVFLLAIALWKIR